MAKYFHVPIQKIMDILIPFRLIVLFFSGLGRTGVLIAAYLVYYLRVRTNDALRYVRLKRPGAVQTRKQIECVKEFEAYFLPQV